MRRASEPIRRLCLGFLLAFVPAVAALPATVSARHASARRRHAASSAKHAHSRPTAHRSRSRRLARPSYVLASARIPSRHFAAASTGFPLPVFPPQDEQRIPRQTSRKTAALQGIVRDRATRGIVGAMIALTNRVTGMTRTISTNADGVFRWIELVPGTYLLLVQSDGFEMLTRDDIRLDAGDVVAVELTLSPSAMSAAPFSRLPRMPELGPPGPAAEASVAAAPYRELRRRPDA
jgi:Carboxypeptidase regulatory-like domain